MAGTQRAVQDATRFTKESSANCTTGLNRWRAAQSVNLARFRVPGLHEFQTHSGRFFPSRAKVEEKSSTLHFSERYPATPGAGPVVESDLCLASHLESPCHTSEGLSSGFQVASDSGTQLVVRLLMFIICTKFPCSSSRELGMDIPLFIHRICSFVFAKGSARPLLCHWFLVDVDGTGAVSGASSPCPPLMVWCIQLISVRSPSSSSAAWESFWKLRSLFPRR